MIGYHVHNTIIPAENSGRGAKGELGSRRASAPRLWVGEEIALSDLDTGKEHAYSTLLAATHDFVKALIPHP